MTLLPPESNFKKGLVIVDVVGMEEDCIRNEDKGPAVPLPPHPITPTVRLGSGY